MIEKGASSSIKPDGLLPHELVYVRKALSAAAISRTEARDAYGEAVANSGGDWALDDPASQAAAQAGHVGDVRFGRQERLIHLAELEYPLPESLVVEVGSRVTVTTPRWEDTYDVASRVIADIPVDGDVELLSAHSSLGIALIGKKVGDFIEWDTPKGTLRGQITKIDQSAQKSFYEAMTEAEADSST